MTDWTDFKRTFTQEQEDAIWQYFIDHSLIQDNGYFGIQFYIKDVDDFWRRVSARYYGDFTRYDVLEKENIAVKKQLIWEELKALRRSAKYSQKINQNHHFYRKNGTPYQKFLLFLKRILNREINKFIDCG